MTAPAPIPPPRLTPRSSEALQRRSRWISRRARNVSRHPLAVLTVTGIAFLALLVVLVVIPVGARRAARAVRPRPGERPDTTALAAAVARGSARLAAATAALDSGRAATVRASAPPPVAVDTTPPELVARRDSLARLSGQLLALLRRASDAPLAESYRALGEAPAMRRDPRVRALLDSLAQVERTRQSFGAAGGVDPVFIALTTRATNIGQQIQRLAQERYAAMHHEVIALTPQPPPRDTVTRVAVDTMPLLAARDSAITALGAVRERLIAERAVLAALDRREARARQLASVGASPLAMLAAAAVLGVAIGFLLTFVREAQRPRVSDAFEAETVVEAPVLVRIEPVEANEERSRRRSDREVSPLIDLVTDRYSRLYFQLADSIARMPRMAVVGDDPATVATVAANLAAAAAHTARNVLLVDTDFDTRPVSAALNVRGVPGLAEVLARRVPWTDALSAALVGRERIIDVLPAGSMKGGAALSSAAGALREELDRLARRYDSVIVSAPASSRGAVSATAAAMGEVIMCARIGRTPISVLQRLLVETRDAGARIRGVVLWEAEDPVLRAPEERPSVGREPWGRTAELETMAEG